ncbi:hypothetical protein PIB30_082264 [Stylosanthes scabra]|uniref:Putative plant transposon protein domain-containing protein n=1 Tax=Stylosanthes scabra TaxID=79078 RepID=A0ABU6ZQJ6_9FABA|nr:hypothetical protein [Stylosanthes scabra]
MASSSNPTKRRRGKELVTEPAAKYDAYRFKSLHPQQLFHDHVASKATIPDTKFQLAEGDYPKINHQITLRGWKRLCKPRKEVGCSLVREFYTNARLGVEVSFNMDRTRKVLKIGEQIGADMSYRRHMILEYQDLDSVIRDLCVPTAQWTIGAGGAPLHLKRHDLLPIPRGWHEFIIHLILPSQNKFEVTLKRGVLIHSIMKSQEVRVEKLIEETMWEIVATLHLDKPLLAFPSIIYCLCIATKVPLEPDMPVPVARPIIAVVMGNVRLPCQQAHQP